MKRFLLVTAAFLLPFSAAAQTSDESGFWQAQPDEVPETAAQDLSGESDTAGGGSESEDAGGDWGFGPLRLGMSSAEVKAALEESPDFSYRQFTESMLPYTDLPVFECKGTKFIDRAVFQFYEDRLYSMTIFFNRRKLDFYTLFTTLTEKCGVHSQLSPERIVWENGTVRQTLTKPLTLAFLDVAVHDELLGRSEVRKDEEFFAKQEFLDRFGAPQSEENSESAAGTGEAETEETAEGDNDTP